jgi:hypothetical protein
VQPLPHQSPPIQFVRRTPETGTSRGRVTP